LRVLLLLMVCSTSLLAQKAILSDYKDPKAQGTLLLQIRDDTAKYVCENLNVNNGSIELCDNNPFINYEYFIHRDSIQKDWLNNVLRVYDYFITIKKPEEDLTWLNQEKKLSVAYKEDFTSNDQITGVTYKHHEARRSIIYYTLINPASKEFTDPSKYQFQYDWEENITGRFESFYTNGIKKFRHKYEIHRIMVFDKGIGGLKKSSVDAQITGTIQEYYSNGKKKTLVTYQHGMLTQKKESDSESQLQQSTRTGERITYRETGRLFSKQGFNLKGLHGRAEYYGPKGTAVIKVENYKDGVLNGKFTEYYLDGKVKTKGEYKEGKKIGAWVSYGENGKKISSEKFN
jgi:antitoxin component YwqK of YwqJK toxin-antitoxin module